MNNLNDFLTLIDDEKVFWIAKRLSGNDTGLTKSHQVGIYLPKNFFKEAFPEIKNTQKKNPDCIIETVDFLSHNVSVENVRAVYYNNKYFNGTRNEFRMTKWKGKESPFQDPENTGALIVFAVREEIRNKRRAYCWVCKNVEQEIFVEQWIGSEVFPGEFYGNYIKSSGAEKFPTLLNNIPPKWFKVTPKGKEIVELVTQMIPHNKNIDSLILKRRELEYEIFKVIEKAKYLDSVQKGFESIEKFVECANTLLQSRKSRSGKSLEYHLANIFIKEKIQFEEQVKTEDSKIADFIFPSGEKYHDLAFPIIKLNMMAAKTCCKDRWRQVLNEADRIETKHLFTLQEGVSINQFNEMRSSRVILVVPRSNIKCFPNECRQHLITLRDFIEMRKQI